MGSWWSSAPTSSGDFTWTSADYIGEAGIGAAVYVDPSTPEEELADHNSRPHPSKLAYDADWDILNQPRSPAGLPENCVGRHRDLSGCAGPGDLWQKGAAQPVGLAPGVWNSWTYPGF